MTSPNPTPTNSNSNPYGHVVVKPDVPNINMSINASIPAPVSTINRQHVTGAFQARSAAQNTLVLQQSGRRIGGSKRSKRSDHKKRSKRSKRSKWSKRSKRSDHKKRTKRTKRSKRSKRGGEDPTHTSSTKPSVAPIPQFSGAHNLGANANSISGNHLLMKTGSQSVFDNAHATPSMTVLN